MAGNTFVLKLGDGSDLFEGLEKLVKENRIEYGMLVSGWGKLKEFELITHETKGGVNKASFDSAFELNAISGKVLLSRSGKFDASIRVSVSSTGFTPKAGQLVKGKAASSLEIGIRKIDFGKIIEA